MRFRERRGRVRRRGVPPRVPRHDHRAGNPRRQRQLPDAEDRQEQPPFRPLGLGYANLGALLMSRGLAYDSRRGARLRRRHHRDDDRRGVPPSARSPATTAALREVREEPRAVPPRHAEAPRRRVPHRRRRLRPARPRARRRGTPGTRRVELGEQHGYRNAQATVLAPTGTIAFMMDCDTTGIEPDIALIKYKKLVGGGS